MIAETWCKTCGQAIATIVMQTGDALSDTSITIELKHTHLKCKRCIRNGVTLKIIEGSLGRGNAI